MLIQIVDDNRNIRATIKSVLSGLQAEFIEASDGDEAVDMYSRHTPDLVIMDIRMARMDGIAATNAIRSQAPKAQVVMITQYDDADLRSAAAAAGAVGYVLKDDLFVLRDFARVIRKCSVKCWLNLNSNNQIQQNPPSKQEEL